MGDLLTAGSGVGDLEEEERLRGSERVEAGEAMWGEEGRRLNEPETRRDMLGQLTDATRERS